MDRQCGRERQRERERERDRQTDRQRGSEMEIKYYNVLDHCRLKLAAPHGTSSTLT